MVTTIPYARTTPPSARARGLVGRRDLLAPGMRRLLVPVFGFFLLAANAAFGTQSQAGPCPSQDLPTAFPFDSFVFRASVVEPVMPAEIPGTPAGGAESHAGWVVQLEVTDPVNLPTRRRRFDLQLFGSDCLAVTRAQLIERFVTGDLVEVAAFPRREEDPGLLWANAEWIRLQDENATRAIETPYEYFETLLRLETRDTDHDRVLILRHLAPYVTDPDRYQLLIDAYLNDKRLRRQLKKVHRVLTSQANDNR